MPEEFVRVDDADLKKRISGQIRAQLDGIGAQKVIVKIEGEADEEFRVDEAFIEKERKEIEDQFTYVLPKKGRVIRSGGTVRIRCEESRSAGQRGPSAREIFT